VLFLDELPDVQRRSIEVLRSTTFPARFVLVAARRAGHDAEQPGEHAAAEAALYAGGRGQGAAAAGDGRAGAVGAGADHILRVARAIADLEGSDAIRGGHVVEAIGYRSLDRTLWAR
jgi:magnesium chelatase family protein